MGEPTIEEYMTKTRDDYGSGIARPKFDEKARFELKQQFLKELLDRCPQHYLTNMQGVILFYKGLYVPIRQILDSKGAVPKINIADDKKSI
ncbi:hypothetical protein Tco_0557887, partial [Tanacetum coccineum]